MKDSSVKAGMIGGLAGLLTFFVLFTLTSCKPTKGEEINASGYDVSRCYKGLIYGASVYEVKTPRGTYRVFESAKGGVCVLPN